MEEKYTLRVVADEGGRELTGLRRATLSALLQENGFDAPTPCGGHGKCGKCRVRAAGDLLPALDADGTCLACQTELTGDAVVWLKAPRMMESIEGLGELPNFERDPVYGEYGLAVDVGTTTVVAQLISLKDGRALAAVAAENSQRAVGRRDRPHAGGAGGPRRIAQRAHRLGIARMEALLVSGRASPPTGFPRGSARATPPCCICSRAAARIRWRRPPSRRTACSAWRETASISRRASARMWARTSSARCWPAA